MLTTLASSYIFRAEIHRARRDMASTHADCEKARGLLRPIIAASTDSAVLAPWVEAHYCLGSPHDAADAERQLTTMGYAHPRYVEYLQRFSTKTTMQ